MTTPSREQVTDWFRGFLDRFDDHAWQTITSIVGSAVMIYGLVYAVGGAEVAGPSFDVIRALMSVTAHGVVTLALGAAVLWSVGHPKWAPVVLAALAGWCMFTGLASWWAFAENGKSPGAVVIWLGLIGPMASVLLLLDPDRSLLYALAVRFDAAVRRRKVRRGRGVA